MPSPRPVDSVLDAIGHTPLMRLHRVVPPNSADVVIKLEYFNPTGSYKDRMALAMIEGAEKRGTLRKGMRVVEYTGGSTGSSLAMVCAIKGYEFHPLSSDAFAKEKLDTMRAFGADLEIVQSDGGKVTPALVRQVQGANRGADAGSEHLLDRSIQQPRRARWLREHRPRAGRADRPRRCVRRRGRLGGDAGRRVTRAESWRAARRASSRSSHRRRRS